MIKQLTTCLLIIATVILSATFTLADTPITSIINTTGEATDVAVSGNYAYVADTVGGLRVINVTDRALPTEEWSDNTIGSARSVALSGGNAYVACDSGVQVYDLADPAAPQKVVLIPTVGQATDVMVVNDIAYISDLGNGLVIVDVSNLSAPATVNTVASLDQTYAAMISGSLMGVAEGVGFRIFDISTPTSPVERSTLYIGQSVRYVSMTGSVAMLGDEAGYLYVVDISNPFVPEIVDSIDPLGTPRSITTVNNFTYVADATNGLRIIDATKPNSGEVATPDVAIEFTANGETSIDVAYDAVINYQWEILNANNIETSYVVTNGSFCDVPAGQNFAWQDISRTNNNTSDNVDHSLEECQAGGHYEITIRATNEVSSTTKTVYINIGVKPPPTVSFTANGSNSTNVAYNGTVNYQWNIQNADSINTTYMVTNGTHCGVAAWSNTPWTTITNQNAHSSSMGSLSPCQAGGKYRITISATNEGGTTTKTVYVNVGISPPSTDGFVYSQWVE